MFEYVAKSTLYCLQLHRAGDFGFLAWARRQDERFLSGVLGGKRWRLKQEELTQQESGFHSEDQAAADSVSWPGYNETARRESWPGE